MCRKSYPKTMLQRCLKLRSCLHNSLRVLHAHPRGKPREMLCLRTEKALHGIIWMSIHVQHQRNYQSFTPPHKIYFPPQNLLNIFRLIRSKGYREKLRFLASLFLFLECVGKSQKQKNTSVRLLNQNVLPNSNLL